MEELKTNLKPIYEDLLKLGSLTGSRAFGSAAISSDWDIIVPVSNMDNVSLIIGDMDTQDSNYFKGFWIDSLVDKKKINIIPLHPYEYALWVQATIEMKNLYERLPPAVRFPIFLGDKMKKYAMFQGYVSLHRALGVIGKEGGKN